MERGKRYYRKSSGRKRLKKKGGKAIIVRGRGGTR